MPESNSSPPGSSVRFHYLKSNQFRVVHMDGAIGGITPRGLLHMAIYNERPALPKVTSMSFDPSGVAQPEEVIESRDGFVREVEVDILFTRQTAAELRDWLTQRLSEYDEAISAAAKKGDDDV